MILTSNFYKVLQSLSSDVKISIDKKKIDKTFFSLWIEHTRIYVRCNVLINRAIQAYKEIRYVNI